MSNAGMVPSTPADGNVKVVLIPTVGEEVTVAELNAETVVDISCYLTAGGWNQSLDEQTISDERLCSLQVFERRGRVTRGLEATYIDNTNSVHEAEFNKAKDTLIPGSSHVVGIRRGVPYDAPFAADQKVEVIPVEAGEYNALPPEANSVLKIQQKLFVTGPQRELTVGAGA